MLVLALPATTVLIDASRGALLDYAYVGHARAVAASRGDRDRHTPRTRDPGLSKRSLVGRP